MNFLLMKNSKTAPPAPWKYSELVTVEIPAILATTSRERLSLSRAKKIMRMSFAGRWERDMVAPALVLTGPRILSR